MEFTFNFSLLDVWSKSVSVTDTVGGSWQPLIMSDNIFNTTLDGVNNRLF